MTDFAEYFRNNPWEGVEDDAFPEVRQLYQEDERFFVSKRDGGKYVFAAFDEADFLPEVKLNIPDIGVEFSQVGTNKRMIITFDNENPVLVEQLIIVVKDIAIHCAEFQGTKFFSEILSRLGSWSEFLKPSRKGLREIELIGLWGELYILNQYFLSGFSPAEGISFWVGPEGSKQDFTFNDKALEIKTTLSENSDRIKISSIEQLEKSTEKLFLLHVFLNKTDDQNSWSIEKLYSDINKKVDSDLLAKNNFNNKVSKLYGRATPEQLNLRFNFLDINIYNVEDGFPGIIASSGLHPAIVKASYQLDPSQLTEFLLQENLEDLISA
tara:strand:- start:3847 stop:4821 length:975 start_codon:yes stop_codon:yes gene_type:complete